MKLIRLIGPTTAALILFTLVAMPHQGAAQGITSLLASANGKGKLLVGREEFNVTAVVVKLKEDGAAEITVVTDLQLLVTGTWSNAADPAEGVDLKITGGTTSSVQGTGKLLLRPDGKSIASLKVEGMSPTAKRKIQLNFLAE